MQIPYPGIDEEHVNPQIVDALRQVTLKVIAESGAQSLAMMHAVATETSGMSMHNAVAAQRQMQMLSAASVTATCAKMLSSQSIPLAKTPPTPPPPEPVKPLPVNINNPFQAPPRVPTTEMFFPTPVPIPPAPVSSLLATLTLTNATLVPSFSPDQTSYQAVPQTGAITISASPVEPTAAIMLQIDQASPAAILPGVPTTLPATAKTLYITAGGGNAYIITFVPNPNP